MLQVGPLADAGGRFKAGTSCSNPDAQGRRRAAMAAPSSTAKQAYARIIQGKGTAATVWGTEELCI